MHIFEKLPQILGLCPILKFRSTLQKSEPQTFRGPPQPKNPACFSVILFQFYLAFNVTLIKYLCNHHHQQRLFMPSFSNVTID